MDDVCADSASAGVFVKRKKHILSPVKVSPRKRVTSPKKKYKETSNRKSSDYNNNRKLPKEEPDGTYYNGKFSTVEPLHSPCEKIKHKLIGVLKSVESNQFSVVVEKIILFIQRSFSKNNYKHLPTVAFITGVSLIDHNDKINLLNDDLEGHFKSSQIVLLSPVRCTSIKTMVTAVLEQQLPNYGSKMAPSLDLLVNNNPNQSFIFIIQCMESINMAVLELFVDMIVLLQKEVQVVMVLGITTALNAQHNLLPFRTSSKLTIERFYLTSPVQSINGLIEKLFMNSSFNFGLSGKALRLLTDSFFYCDFSFKSFSKACEYALLHHCLKPEIALLCENESYIEHMNTGELETIMSLPSLQRYLTKQNHLKVDKIKNDETYKKNIITRLMNAIIKKKRELPALVSAVHVLNKAVIGYPLGRHTRNIYVDVLSGSLVNSKPFQNVMEKLSEFTHDALLSTLMHAHAVLLNNSYENASEFLAIITEHAAEGNIPCQSESSDTRILRGRMDKGKERIRVHKQTIFMGKIKGFFECHLKSPCAFTLHEVFYFSNTSILRTRFQGCPRTEMYKILSSKPEGCAQPLDINIAFKIYQQCGKLINLYDWMQAFQEELSQENVPDEVKQARFVQSVSELQLLGYLKTTKRKVDHMACLSWGCY